MGPTGHERLAARAPPGKAVREMLGGDRPADAPGRCNCSEWIENETARFGVGMRHSKLSRPHAPPAPQDQVQVEHSRAPALSPTAAEVALGLLQVREEIGRRELAFDQSYCVGEVAARATMRPIADDG